MRKLSYAVVPLASLVIAACSGGGGGGSGGGSSTSAASGVLALPSATCGSGVCVQSVSPFGDVSPYATGSVAILQENAEFGYNYINSTFIPLVNSKMYDVEQAFKSLGYDQCGGTATDVTSGAPQINLIPDGTYVLNSSISVTVSGGTLTSPGDNTALQKKFLLTKGGTQFLEVQVGCPNTTTRSLYVRMADSGDMFEAWGYKNSSAKAIYAASDSGGGTRTLYFKSTSANLFEIGAVVKNAALGGAPVTLAISGGANLTNAGHGLLDVQMLTNTATSLSASGGTYTTNDPTYSGGDKRHCYTALDPAAVTATASECANLYLGPASVHLRGAAHISSEWSVNDIGSDPIATF